MRARNTFMALLLAAVFFGLAGLAQRPLNRQRAAYLPQLVDPLENTPPLVAFTTVALGGFRGIITDLLWLRVSKLQEEGSYFELVQLADWITKLEPRFPAVWAFHAWNMAYNISVLLNDPAERWRWVNQGVKLLRDKGLYYNPGEASLYWELAWLFYHKIGADFDDAHPYYQQQLAKEMTEVLGGPHPNYQALQSDPGLRERLMNDFKLDPAIMEAIDRAYGPLDWRLPESQALYWAWRGREVATGFELVQLDRMVYHALDGMVTSGTRTFGKPMTRAPDFDLLPQAIKAHEAAITLHPTEITMPRAYRSFLNKAAGLLRDAGRFTEARALELQAEAIDTADMDAISPPGE